MAHADVPNVVFEMDVDYDQPLGDRFEKIILTLFFCLLIAAISCLVFNAISFNLYTPFFSFLFFGAIGVLLLRGNTRAFYLLSFFTYVLFSHLLAWSFYKDHSSFFIGGGDDEFFYNIALNFAREGIDVSDPYYVGLSSKGYIHILAGYVGLLDFLGFRDKSYFFDLVAINNALGAFAVAAIYRLTKNGLDIKLRLKYCIFLVFFPFVVYYSSTLLRDVYVLFSLTLVAFLLSSKLKNFTKVILIVLSISILGTVRPASALFVLTLPIAYILLSIRSLFWRSFVSVIIVSISIVSYVQLSNIYGLQVDATSEMYTSLVENEASGDSIGAKLRGSKNPILIVVGIFYTIYSPIPPPIVKDTSFRNTILSIGSFLWYFLLPAFFFSLWYNYKKINFNRFDLVMKAFTVTFIATLIAVSITSGDPRHLLLLYPLVLLGAFQYIYYKKRAYMKFLIIYFVFGLVLVAGYAALKLYI